MLSMHLKCLGYFLIFVTITSISANFKLTVIHTNDMHSRMEEINARTGRCNKTEGPCYGGFARVAYEAKRLKSDKKKNTVFLNAGDTYQGTPLHTFFKYKMLVPLMKQLQIDVMSLGNHEFDDGIKGLAPYLQQVGIPVVACNINTTREPSLKNHTSLKEYHMLKVKDVNIAVIGYILPDTKFLSNTGDVEFYDEVDTIRKYAKEAKEKENASLVFAIGHAGIDIDKKIAEEVEEIDLVVGGHTDTFLYTGKKPDSEKPYGDYPLMITQSKTGKRVPVVQAFGYTKYLGKLDLEWYDNFTLINATGNPILLDSTKEKDNELEKEISEWAKNLTKILAVSKGASRVFLNGSCRFNECNFGNFITDAFAYYVVNETKATGTYNWTRAPIVLLNGGSVRTSIARSESITLGSLLTALPFAKQLVLMKMKGIVLFKALNRSIERYDVDRQVGRGEFLQMSGMKVKYVQQANGNLTVAKAYVRCGVCPVPKYYTLNENLDYSVVTTTFVADGGDGFFMFRNETTREATFKLEDLTIVANYMEKLKIIYPSEEGRVRMPGVLKKVKVKGAKKPKEGESDNAKELNALQESAA